MPPCTMLRALVDYSDDSDDENTQKEVTKTHSPSQPKRKNDLPHRPNSPSKKAKALPALDTSLFTPCTLNPDTINPRVTLNLGFSSDRRPFKTPGPKKDYSLQGDFLALLRRIVGCAQSNTTAWHSLLENVSGITSEQTPSSTSSSFRSHLSLSRPVPLRAHQRDGFRKEVRKAALERTQFVGSFAQLTTLTNEDQSRTFLCVEIGAGHNEFHALSQSLSAHLASLRQLPYYPQPRFHISIAWILAHSSPYSALAECDQGASENRVGVQERTPEPNVHPSSHMSPLIDELQAKFSKQLLDLGRFNVQTVEVKIGKDTHRWPLTTRL